MTDSRYRPLAGCKTTAMSILPHHDIDPALDLVLGLDIPFWPQLPNVSFREDMYFQAAYDFPGIILDPEEGKIRFSHDKFEEEIGDYSRKLEDPDGFTLSPDYGSVYHKFLTLYLADYPAVHGQVTGPVNLGFRINDEEGKPIVYDDNLRGLLFDFIQRKFNTQYRQLQEKNRNAFVWLDEPGMVWVFSGLSGYNDVQAKRDYREFLTGLEGLKALHLCTNINLSYLLELGVEFVSFDAYQLEVMPRGYTDSVAKFIRGGGIICWGIVPTEPGNLRLENPDTLWQRLLGYWEVVAQNTGLPVPEIAAQAVIAPAKCCVKSAEFSHAGANGSKIEENGAATTEEASVARAYGYLKELSLRLKDKFALSP